MSLRTTSDGKNSNFNIECELCNQKDITVFSCEKSMIFPFIVPQSDVALPPSHFEKEGSLLSHLISEADALQRSGSQTLSSVRPGQLIVHGLQRPIPLSSSMQLASLARLSHGRHFNTSLYKLEEMTVPGGLILGMTLSLASKDLYEVLHEELSECVFPNHLNPGEVVSALTFILKLEEHVSGDIEAITVRTIGVKNCDVIRYLKGKKLPGEVRGTLSLPNYPTSS